MKILHHSETIERIARPQVEIDAAVCALTTVSEERCTIVHCRYFTTEPAGVRIWPSTCLIEDTGARPRLIQPFNISLYPHWTFHFIEHDYIRFTLVFEGLTSSCRQFYLKEQITEPHGFYTDNIKRNQTDVYEAEILIS